MATLALQIFLLLFAAFLIGCVLGCLLRRAFYDRDLKDVERELAAAGAAGQGSSVVVKPASPGSERFERALTSGAQSAPQTVARSTTAPVTTVEVRKAAPADAPTVATQPAPAPAAPSVQPSVAPASVAPAPVQVAPAAPQPPKAAPPPPVTPAPMPARPVDVRPVASVPAAPPAPSAVPATAPAAPALAPGLVLKPVTAPAVGPAPMPARPVDVRPVDVRPQSPAGPAAPPKPTAAETSTPMTAAALAAAAAAAAAVAKAPAPPAPATASPQASPASQPADDLQRIRSIDGPLQSRLNAAGISRFQQIASWGADDVVRMNQVLGFVGRIEQENWIEQAQILARGGETEFARRRRLGIVDVPPPPPPPPAPKPAAVAPAPKPAPPPPPPQQLVDGPPPTTTVGVAAAAAAAAASVVAQRIAGPDKLMRIIGIDAGIEKALIEMGVERYQDIARWASADIEKVEKALNLPGRIGLDNWIEQARVLARYSGDGDAGAVRPAKLQDAIRETREAGPATRVPAAGAAAGPGSGGGGPRPELAGLRSVKSEALRGDQPISGDRIDDLKRIRGVGVLIERRLNSIGVHTYEQVANWSGADIDRISQMLEFKGRIERENWIEQARILASGGQTEFSRRFDRGEVDSSKDG
ncbi:MAG: hypothetical protein NW216_03530 [Hyphomicrobium sp.]|nr:hypothetical protein [Hyphomicrobium sp.]